MTASDAIDAATTVREISSIMHNHKPVMACSECTHPWPCAAQSAAEAKAWDLLAKRLETVLADSNQRMSQRRSDSDV